MIEFSEMDEFKFRIMPLHKIHRHLEKPGVTLEFTLMIESSQSLIVDENFLSVLDPIEFSASSTMGEEEIFDWGELPPVAEHLHDRSGGLM